MRVVVGLGNPGSEYESTRHNIGFRVVEALAIKIGVTWKRGSEDYLSARGSLNENGFLLVKPLTYMNNSGTAVRELLEDLHLGSENLLVLVDDFHLPLGTIRFRSKGSDGGHNGLHSIRHEIGSASFPRLRCGIAGATIPDQKHEFANFVLTAFEETEKSKVEQMIGTAAEFCLQLIRDDISTVQNNQTIKI